MGNLVFGSSERPGNPIDAAEIPIVRDNDVVIGQGARPTERPEKTSAKARHRPTDRITMPIPRRTSASRGRKRSLKNDRSFKRQLES